jgi:hypothetical protein
VSGVGQGITSVDFTELRGSPSGSATPDGTTAQRKLKVAWDDFPTAMREAVGWAERQGAGKLSRWLPESFPRLTVINKPNYPSLYAVSVGWEPWGYDWKDPDDPVGGGGANTIDETSQGRVHRYSHAILTVGYSTLPYNVYADDEISGDESRRFTNVTSKASAKMVSLRGTDLVWDDAAITSGVNTKKVNADALMVEAEETVQVYWHRLPVEAVASVAAQPDLVAGSAYLDNLVGCVNSAAIWGYAAGTLLFFPADIQVKQDWYMGDSCEVTLQMVHNRNGHNKIYLAADQAYRLVKSDAASGARRIFAEANFADAFKIP